MSKGKTLTKACDVIDLPKRQGTRDANGRFIQANPGGPGNPHACEVSRLRAAMLSQVTPDELQRIIAKLIELAIGGDVKAAREVLDRVLGKPQQSLMLTEEVCSVANVRVEVVDTRDRSCE